MSRVPGGIAAETRRKFRCTTDSNHDRPVAPNVLGRDFEASDDHLNGTNVLILSDGLWRRRFGGDRTIVGRQVTLNGNARLRNVIRRTNAVALPSVAAPPHSWSRSSSASSRP